MTNLIQLLEETYKGSKGYYIIIRNNTTEEIVSLYHPYPFNNFWLTEGNYGCDCNRSMEFQRAKGIKEESIVAAECGYDLYDILWVVMNDGMTLPVDAPKEN